MSKYIFTSERLGFRNWGSDDLETLVEMNTDDDVMEHFPNILNLEDNKAFLDRLIKHFNEHNYNYFATEIIKTGELIGFIGLAYQTYKTEFTPATDIGWRLKKSSWGNGYATEGAKRCIKYAFETLKIEKVIAICTKDNSKSENVMIKIGMIKQGSFNHPKLKAFPEYEECIYYNMLAFDYLNSINSK